MLDRRDSGKVECRTGVMHDWRVQECRNAGKEGCKKVGMQESRDAGKQGCRKGGIQEMRDSRD